MTTRPKAKQLNLDALMLVNEVKGWPALVGPDLDLAAQNQWWDVIGTPTTGPTMVDVAGEGLTETFKDCLKCVADANAEGFQQTWTFAEEPRLKAGRRLSALCAVWCVGGLGVTVKLVNSDASETAAAKVTAAAWSLVEVPNHLLAGTSCDLRFITDGAGTFYVVPCANLGPWGLWLPPRGLVYKHKDNPPAIKNLSGLADENLWNDIDCTAVTSPLAAVAQVDVRVSNPGGSSWDIRARRNGATTDDDYWGNFPNQGGNNAISMVLDDAQVFEYWLDRYSGSATLTSGRIMLRSWWEWA